MPKYVDREALEDLIDRSCGSCFEWDLLDEMSIDLVSCDECRWCKVDGGFRHCMMSAIIHPTADDYCSLGERKDAKTN